MKTYFFDNDGKRFSTAYLQMMKAKILSLSITEQSEFVDMVTYENVKAGRVILKSGFPTRNQSVTVIGNIAFIALFHPIEDQKRIARFLLKKIKNTN